MSLQDFLASVHLKHIVGLQELHMAAREDPHSLDGYRMRITAGGSSRLTPVGVASPAVHETWCRGEMWKQSSQWVIFKRFKSSCEVV